MIKKERFMDRLKIPTSLNNNLMITKRNPFSPGWLRVSQLMTALHTHRSPTTTSALIALYAIIPVPQVYITF